MMKDLVNRLRHWSYGLLLLNGFVPACLGLAFLLRLAWMLTFDVRPYSDFAWYYDRGLEIARGAGYAVNGKPTAYWPVGYPALLGLLFWLFGPSITIAQLANVGMYMGIIYVSYTLSQQIFTSETIARITLLLLTIYPNHIAYSALLASETAFLLLLMVGVAASLRSISFRRHCWSVVAGAVFGLATLIRPQALLVPVIVLWPCLGVPGALQRVIRNGAFLYISLLLVVLPWTIRNALVFQHFIFVSTNGGINLLIGNNPRATGAYIWNEEVSAPVRDIEDEYERNRTARAAALEYIKNNPLRTVMLWPNKLLRLYLYDTEGVATNLDGLRSQAPRMRLLLKFLIRVAFAYYVVVMLLAFTTLLLMMKRKNEVSSLAKIGWGMILYFTLLHLVFFGYSRYHFQNMPWIMMYAAVPIAMWLSRSEATEPPEVALSAEPPAR